MRSLNTSFVALLPVGVVAHRRRRPRGCAGAPRVGLPLFIGLIVGAYSSIFVATPLTRLVEGTGAGATAPWPSAVRCAPAVTPRWRWRARSTARKRTRPRPGRRTAESAAAATGAKARGRGPADAGPGARNRGGRTGHPAPAPPAEVPQAQVVGHSRATMAGMSDRLSTRNRCERRPADMVGVVPRQETRRSVLPWRRHQVDDLIRPRCERTTRRPTSRSSSAPTPSPTRRTPARSGSSGEPYITHPVAVAQILADLGLGPKRDRRRAAARHRRGHRATPSTR